MLSTYDLNAPAQVVAHLGSTASDDEWLYPTLRQAIECAQVDLESLRPWIITRDGSILSPRKIEMLKGELLSRIVKRAGRL
ncbi:MAG: hypothetical protein PVSMB4_16170 [Ktedonobacterales bacterium]